MIRDAVTCDRPGCDAFYLDLRPLRGLYSSERLDQLEELVRRAGWRREDGVGHLCPACAPKPVYDRAGLPVA
ncbi:hypothetical protein AB0B15_42940 [Streptomyces sp. NPDC045456]|uniref:hypothetical protein n=1 Tax=Streptomyces sp. NPDC045456 TaxID=3155254 RepID=UPI0033F37841